MHLRIGNFELNLTRSKSEKRSRSISDWAGWASIFGESANSSEEIVTESTMMRISTVSACLKILGEDIAALPKCAMRRDGNKRTKDTSNRLNYLISTKPNKHMTSYNWTFALIVGAAGWGESYAPVVKDRYGNVESLELIAPWDMYRVPMPDGSIYYQCVSTRKVYNADDMIILKPFSVDGKNPISIIRYNAETMGFALQSQKYRGKVFKIKPPGYLGSDHPITEAQVKDIGKYWSGQVASGMPVAYGGLKYHPISFTPADLQLLESNKLTEQQICSLFRMPPTFVQDYDRATFANAEQQGIVYKTYTLNPFVTNMMQELDAKCYPEANQMSENPGYVNINMNGLLVGDFKTRTEGYRALQNMGVLSQNDVRAMEDMDPIDGGDEHYVPMNMISIKYADEFYKKLIATVSSKEKAGAAEMKMLSDLINSRSMDDSMRNNIAALLEEHGIKLEPKKTNGHAHA
jgi:HK97 family phage portal protein